MYKILPAKFDTYITDKFVNGERQVSASLGYAGTLDIFKLYGISEETSGSTKIPLREISRALVEFDTTDLEDLLSDGKIDISHPTFKCEVKFKDVYGGQTTPRNFKLVLSPLSRSFSEGTGKDVSYYSDWDVANFLSSSRSTPWVQEGAAAGGALESGPCDFITTALLGNALPTDLQVTQSFVDGTEDAIFDITHVMSAALVGGIPNVGFRLALAQDNEDDIYTYFVKRFASRHAHNQLYRPKMIVKFDDSIQDTASTMFLGSPGSLFAYNYGPNGPNNFFSGAQELTGSNCVKLVLTTQLLSGQYTISFSGSQYSKGTVKYPGVYSADVFVPLTSELTSTLACSGSLTFTPIWTSFDGTVSYLTGSVVKFSAPYASSTAPQKKRYTVSAYGLPDEIKRNSSTLVRFHVFDQLSPLVNLQKFSSQMPSVGVRNAHYQVRDVLTNDIIVPFDTELHSTRVSTDSQGQYVYLDTSALTSNRSYVIDFMITDSAGDTLHKNVCNPFRVVDS